MTFTNIKKNLLFAFLLFSSNFVIKATSDGSDDALRIRLERELGNSNGSYEKTSTTVTVPSSIVLTTVAGVASGVAYMAGKSSSSKSSSSKSKSSSSKKKKGGPNAIDCDLGPFDQDFLNELYSEEYLGLKEGSTVIVEDTSTLNVNDSLVTSMVNIDDCITKEPSSNLSTSALIFSVSGLSAMSLQLFKK